MAKQDDKGGKIRFVLFEMEGSNETLQESLRTVTGALNRGMNPVRTVVTRPAPQAIGAGKGKTNGRGDGQVVESILEDDLEGTDQVIDIEAESPAPSTASKPKRKAHYTTPKVLNLDLTSGGVPLQDFLQQKGLNTDSMDSKKYLAIAAWFSEYRNLEYITPDHVHTCYRFMSWGTPKDVALPFRNMKRHGWFEKGKEPNSYKINHIGMNVVNKIGKQAEEED